jgi:hypothetical protein
MYGGACISSTGSFEVQTGHLATTGDGTPLLTLVHAFRRLSGHRPVWANTASGRRAPWIWIFAAASSISPRSSEVRATSAASRFSSRRASFVVPAHRDQTERRRPAVDRAKRRPGPDALEHGELLPEHQDLHDQACARARDVDERAEQH